MADKQKQQIIYHDQGFRWFDMVDGCGSRTTVREGESMFDELAGRFGIEASAQPEVVEIEPPAQLEVSVTAPEPVQSAEVAPDEPEAVYVENDYEVPAEPLDDEE